VHSNLGNGKSLFIEGLRLSALEKGYRVFGVSEHVEAASSELEAVSRLPEKTLITIEEYQNWLNEIRFFRLNSGSKAVLVLTIRSAINDVVIDDLMDAVGVSQIPEINLDRLQEQEINWFIDALDTYGLWGEMAGQQRWKKEKYIAEICQSQFHSVLLKLLASPHIGQRIRRLAEKLKVDSTNYKVLLSILILTLLNYEAHLDMLADIWGIEAVSNAGFRRDPVVKEFVDFNTGGILVKSSIAAEYLLHSTANAAAIVEVLVTMTEHAEKGSRVSILYDGLFKNLMRFHSLQVILPEENRRNAVISYYESIKNLPRCKNHPLFWLQYAIAALVLNDLVRSKRYFDTAYSLATSTHGFDTFQIDNHYARFLLVQGVRDLEHDEATENFRLARAILFRQIRDERRHYPYKVAILFQDFLDRFGASLSKAVLEEVSAAATRMLERIGQLPEQRRRHRNVVDCVKAMGYVVNRAKEIISSKPC
jgi:hypothetical protein